MNTLPTKKDISPKGDLDSCAALNHFLDKNVEQALDMFRKDDGFYCYIEDLAWMGGYAFSYYFQAVIKYCYEELEKTGNVVAIMNDLIELLKLRGIMDSNSFQWKKSQIDQIIYIAIEKLEKNIKEMETIPLQRFYELTWDKQRKMNKIKKEYTNCVTVLRQFVG